MIQFKAFVEKVDGEPITSKIRARNSGYSVDLNRIRKQKIPFRYDWEKIISPVIDYELTRFAHIDPKRIALMINYGLLR